MKLYHNHLLSECACHRCQSLTDIVVILPDGGTTESVHCVHSRQANRTSSVRTYYNQPSPALRYNYAQYYWPSVSVIKPSEATQPFPARKCCG